MWLEDLRRIAGNEASVPALRAVLFLFGMAAALAWARRRPLLALGFLAVASFLGLGYWLVQIVSPLGLGTDPALSRDWAQAGVNAFAEPRGSGFVWGTDPQHSLVAALATARVPFLLIAVAPQLVTLLAAGLVLGLPFLFLRNRTTASLSASLAIGGGLWPGIAPYGSFLQKPAALVGAFAVLVTLLGLAQRKSVRRAFERSRLRVCGSLIVAASLDRAFRGGTEPTAAMALLLCVATMILTGPLRSLIRRGVSDPARARRVEALVLLCAWGGSGLFWWDPPKSVAVFRRAKDGNEALRRSMDWMRRNIPAGGVVLASPAYSAQIAALAGRRVLLPPAGDESSAAPLREPFRRARLVESTRVGAPLARLAEAFSVTHLFLGPGEADPPAGRQGDLAEEPRLRLDLVYQDPEDFRVFRLAKK